MENKRSHHYIPRFYLKKFSINEKRKVVGLYNHTKNIFISQAAIKHQACEKYLYGRDDEIENELSKLESAVAGMFDIMLKHFIPPLEDQAAFTLLKRYILYQSFRTPKAGEDVMESLNQALVAVVKVYYPYKEKDLGDSKLVHSDPVLLALVNSADKVHLLDYLSCKLIVNLSYLPFITSDNPVVKYNQFLEAKEAYVGATGIAVKGIQIFLPIHPRMMICLYDPAIYTCGEDHKVTVITESIDEVHQLNSLQYLNSHSQLFFNDFISKEYIEAVVEQHSKAKYQSGPFSLLTKSPNSGHFFHTATFDAPIKLDLSFFKLKEEAQKADCTKTERLRHPSFYEKQK